MRYRFAIQVGADVPEGHARNVFWAIRAVRPTWLIRFTWPASRYEGQFAYVHITGEIEALTEEEARLIVFAGLDDAQAKRDELATEGVHEWPNAPTQGPFRPIDVTEWPSFNVALEPVPMR